VQHPRTYAIYAYLAAGGATLGGVALAAALAGDRRGHIWWPVSRLGSGGMLAACGVRRLRVDGGERLARLSERPAVVVCNHESLFDPAVLMKIAPSPLRFVVKGEVRRTPIFGRALEAMGHVFVARGGNGSGLEQAARRVAEGGSVLVFPEGTRSPDGELLPFKTGAFRLAAEAGVPVLPCALSGTGKILPKHGGWRGSGTVGIAIGEPLTGGGPAEAAVLDLAERARAEIRRLRERASALARET
jgi:1-acyl-sn-glycerol-3-phosphate acyltransferase